MQGTVVASIWLLTNLGAPEKILGAETASVCDEMQIIDGVVIQPSMSCYTEEQTEEPEVDIKME